MLNKFHGNIKSSVSDFLTQTQIYSLQIVNERTKTNEYDDLNGIIQFSKAIEEKEFEKNQEVFIMIDTEGMKFFTK